MMKYHLNPGIINNCSEEEKQKYKTLYENFHKKVKELNNFSETLQKLLSEAN